MRTAFLKVCMLLIALQSHAEDMWSPRAMHSAVAYRDKMWIFGGGEIDSGTYYSPLIKHLFKDIWNSTDGKNWICLTSSAPWEPCIGQAVTVFQNKLWLMAGITRKPNPNANDRLRNYEMWERNSDVWCTENALEWKFSPESPWSKHAFSQALEFMGKMLLIGIFHLNEEDNSTAVWETDDGKAWRSVSEISQTGERVQAIINNGVIYIFLINSISGVESSVRTLASSDGIHWEQLADFVPWACHRFTLISFNNKMFVLGGQTENGMIMKSIWTSGDGVKWDKLTDCVPWQERMDPAAVVFKDRIWITGGYVLNNSDSYFTNDIWSSLDGINWIEEKKATQRTKD